MIRIPHYEPLDPEALPTNDEGEPFQYVLITGEESVFSDSATQLVDILVDGHGQASDNMDAFAIRYRHSVEMAHALQGAELERFAQTEHGEAFLDDAAALTVVMTAKDDPIRPDLVPQDWSGEHVPTLFLVSMIYPPNTNNPKPVGDKVIMLDAYTELDYLRSLADCGLVQFHEHRE